MTEWKEYKLGDLAFSSKKAIISGPFGSNIGSRFFVNSGVPVIRGNNLPNDMRKFNDEGFVFVTQEKADELNCYAIKDDLLFTAAGTIGQVGLLTGKERFEKYVISNKQIRVRLNKNIVLPLFAYYWFSTIEMNNYIKNRNTGSTIPLINLGVIKDLPIRLPSIKKQSELIEILSSLDDKIELNNKINQELENLAHILFKRWFVDFEFPNENGEPYKSSGGEMVDSELGEIPKSWVVSIINDWGQIICGKTPSKNKKEYFGNDILFIKIPDMHNNVFITKTEDGLSILGANSQKNKLLKKGSVILSSIATVGLVSIVSKDSQTNQQINAIVPYNTIYTYYLYLILKTKSDDFKQLASGGSATLNMNTSTFKAYKILMPSELILNQFNSIMSDLFDKIYLQTLEIEELTNLRDTLLPKLISGELEVNNTNI